MARPTTRWRRRVPVAPRSSATSATAASGPPSGPDSTTRGEHGYDAVVILNAIGKFDPAGLGVLLEPLQDGSADLVQGSRFVAGGSFTRMPMKRQLGTRAYSALFSLLLGQWVTDASSGIRAFRCSILDTPGLDVAQSWLDRYELEPYILWKALELGLRVVEVPMDVKYPEGPRASYTRMRPIIDWWRLSRPLLILTAERLRRGRAAPPR